jgi:tRNA dimethylallyltransferase
VPPVLAVVGPTGTGKSDLGVALARALGGEVVNADSMQLYRGMDVGTAKLTPGQRAGIRHHLLDVWDVTHTATAAAYQGLARGVIDELLARGVTPVLVGGSGLYLRAALDELSFPGTDPELRAALEAELEQNGALALHARLAALDHAAAGRMEPTNGRRVVRALEVVLMTGGMPGELTSYDGHYDVTYLGLDRDDLADRTDARVDRMWAAGLVEEVRALEQVGLREGVTASRALGYAQVLAMFDGTYDESQAIETTKSATRRFVRRQRAWFRRDPRISWLDPDADPLQQGMGVLASK